MSKHDSRTVSIARFVSIFHAKCILEEDEFYVRFILHHDFRGYTKLKLDWHLICRVTEISHI